MAISDDISIDPDSRDISIVDSATYSVLELHRWLQTHWIDPGDIYILVRGRWTEVVEMSPGMYREKVPPPWRS